jgi:hypothetical protein
MFGRRIYSFAPPRDPNGLTNDDARIQYINPYPYSVLSSYGRAIDYSNRITALWKLCAGLPLRHGPCVPQLAINIFFSFLTFSHSPV